MKIRHPDIADVRDERRLLELLEKLVNVANRIENMTAGPGVSIQRAAGGVSISAKPRTEARSSPGGAAAEGSIHDTKVLARLQGTRDTDSWTRGGDTPARSVKAYLITDAKYDETTLQFTIRARACTFDTAGCLYSIDAEDEDATLVFTAVLCEGTPS